MRYKNEYDTPNEQWAKVILPKRQIIINEIEKGIREMHKHEGERGSKFIVQISPKGELKASIMKPYEKKEPENRRLYIIRQWTCPEFIKEEKFAEEMKWVREIMFQRWEEEMEDMRS